MENLERPSRRTISSSLYIFIPGGVGTANTKLRDIWSVGGRAGLAVGNWLPYVTGGYAQGSFSFYAASLPPSGTNTEAADATQHGAYIGGGVEVALIGSAILGVEYRHYGFNTKDVFILTAEGTPETVRFDTKTDVVMARLSWKFGDWGTPYYPAVVK